MRIVVGLTLRGAIRRDRLTVVVFKRSADERIAPQNMTCSIPVAVELELPLARDGSVFFYLLVLPNNIVYMSLGSPKP